MQRILFEQFERRLDRILLEAKDREAAVAIVQDRKKWLLGLAVHTSDGRTNKWCMPGGGLNHGEDPSHAAVRECREETGIQCKAVGKPFTLPGNPHVHFVHCRVTRSGQQFKRNHEFAALGFFSIPEMRSLKLYHNVLKLIQRAARK